MIQKWIINNCVIKMSSTCKYHADICSSHTTTLGGGWWYLDRHNKKLYLYSKSEAFGPCTREQVVEAFKKTHFPEYLEGVKVYFSRIEDLTAAIQTAELIGEIIHQTPNTTPLL